MFNILLPTLKRCALQSAMLLAVIDGIQPHVESRVQILQRAHLLVIHAGQKLFPDGSEKSFNLATSLRLIRWRVYDQNADGSANTFQLPRTKDLTVIDIQPHRHATGGYGVAQTIQQTIQT